MSEVSGAVEGIRQSQVHIPAAPLTSCATTDRLFSPLSLSFPIYKMEILTTLVTLDPYND